MELPSVYANKIEKEIKNNDEVYHNDGGNARNSKNVRELIRFFDKSGYAEKLVVKLYFNDGTQEVERLILFKDNYFVNLDNKKIYLDDVIDYEIK